VSLLVVDVYQETQHGHPVWAPLLADPTYVGAILKCTQGIAYPTAWFHQQWSALRAAAGDRYGASFVRGAYHFLMFDDDPVRQATYYLDTVAAAGGWDHGDLIPIVDVERADGNEHATAAQVTACVTAFVAEVAKATGQDVMIYGRGAMRDLHITSTFGAQWLWNPGYTATMPSAAEQGWPDDTVALWQYTDGTHGDAPGLPRETPGLGAVDASVYRGASFAQLCATIVRRASQGARSTT